MRKSTFAKIATLSMVPALFWSQDSFAVPAFARKYQTSCYTCHSGFPNRNAFGEAFKNNGYRWPGGEDEDHAKQEQTKMGANGWKQTFPDSPWPSDIPGFAPFAVYVTGPIVKYVDQVKDKNGVQTATGAQQLTWQGPINARILYGATIGENFGVVGGFENLGTNLSPTTNLRATWAFAPGVNLSFGQTGFSAFGGLASPISVFTSVFPASGTGPEFSYAVGKEGGFNFIAGLASAASSTGQLDFSKKLDDTRYLRAKYKFFGAGLLSGANGTYGNEYVGLDNSLAIGASLVSARDAVLASNYAGETLVYGVDLAGNVGSFTGGVAFSKDQDLKLNNYAVDAGYYLYPWLLARVRYANLGRAGVDQEIPTLTPSLTAWLRANIFVQASYVYNTKNIAPATANTTGVNNANSLSLNAGYAF